jgi:2,3-dihydroxybenzoate-AMP ligase
MLEGCTPWPENLARRYRELGYWQGITLCEMLERSIRLAPAKTALVHGARRVSYGELGERVSSLAAALLQHGLRAPQRVVLQLPNSVELLIVLFALSRIGVIPVLALPAHRRSEIAHFIDHAGAIAYFCPDRVRDHDYGAMAKAVSAQCASLRQVFMLGAERENTLPLCKLIWDPPQLGTAVSEAVEAPPSSAEVALMLLSGGTTGLPKLIPRTHDDYLCSCRHSSAVAGFGPATVFLATLPIAHNFTLACPGVLGALMNGGTAVIAASTAADEIFPLIERERVTVVAAAVPLVVNWLNTPAPERHDLGSLELFMSGGAKLVPELRRRIEQRLGCTYMESFGTGEGLLNMTRLDDPEDIRHTSSGRPVCEADEVKVVDEEGHELPDGEAGELLVRGPYTVRGYYRAPEATRAAYTSHGYYRMGDIVRRVNGYLYVEGRRKDIINRGGEKISCEEVENHLIAHPKVRAACVVAMPDATYGEKACAFVIPAPDTTLALEEVKQFLVERQIAKFKLPERLELVADFPLSPAGKILRRELRRIIAEKLAGPVHHT